VTAGGRGPIGYDSPGTGRIRALTLVAPNGVIVELFEPEAGLAPVRKDQRR
jgi:hypothetical protein